MDGLTLDHVGFMVRDLDKGVICWEKLGFKLSPRSSQIGIVPGISDMARWATSNHCVMFKKGYLELIGITNSESFNPWSKFFSRFEGPHITALRCKNADDAYEILCTRAEHFDPPLQRLRKVPQGDEEKPFKFKNIFSQDEYYPEGRFIIIEHQTPELIWQKALLEHPNRAIALRELCFCAENKDGTLERLRAITGRNPKFEAGQHVLDLGNKGKLTVIDVKAFSAQYPIAPVPVRMAISAVVVEVENLRHLTEYLNKSNVPFNMTERQSLWVMPQFANGAVIKFVAGS